MQYDRLHICAAQIIPEEYIWKDKYVTFTLTDSLLSSNNHISCKRPDLWCETQRKTYFISLAERLISC